ncbi:MAG: hypothetical protein V3S01_08135, partial [Dehalococcoidia bacterium]
RKRTAAHINRKAKKMSAKIIECTDQEAEMIELIENACRRHDKDEQAGLLVKLVDVMEEDVLAEWKERVEEPTVGRPKKSRTEARERVAQAAGLRPDSVRKAEQRHEHKEATKVSVGGPSAIELFDIAVEDAFIAEVKKVIQYTEGVSSRAMIAIGQLKQLGDSDLDFPPAVVQKASLLLKEVHVLIRGYTPASLCPYCKGVGDYQAECTACRTLGWVGRLDKNAVPPELLEPGVDGWIMDRGELVALADVIDTTPEPYEGAEVKPDGDVTWPPTDEGNETEREQNDIEAEPDIDDEPYTEAEAKDDLPW